MPTKRFTGAAAVRRSGVIAGSIDSSSGSASVTPAPRRNVRRGRCFLVTNIDNLPAGSTEQDPAYAVSIGPGLRCLHRTRPTLATAWLLPSPAFGTARFERHRGRE